MIRLTHSSICQHVYSAGPIRLLTRAERRVGSLELLTRGKLLSLGVYALVEVDIVLLNVVMPDRGKDVG